MKPNKKRTILRLLCSLLIFSTAQLFSTSVSSPIRLGGENDKGMLYRPFQADEGPDGNIYIFDAKDAYIKVFSSDGAYSHRMGGRGQGPGEMVRLGSFGFTPDRRIFFTEMINGHKWITFLNLNGTFERVLKLDIDGSYGIQRAAILPGGQIVAEIHYWGIPKKTSQYYTFPYLRRLATINQNGKVEKTIILRDLPFSISMHPSGGDTRLPYFPEFLWACTTNGTIIFSEGNNSTFILFKLDDSITGSIKTTLPPTPNVTGKDISTWKRELKENMIKRFGASAYNRYASVVEKYNTSLFKTQPLYCELSVTPSGNYLVKGSRTSKGPERPFFLLNPNGEIISQITTSASEIKYTENFLIVIGPDEEDNDQVSLFPLKQHNDRKALQAAAGLE